MKKKISVAVAVIAFIMLAGFVGGMDLGTITLAKGFAGSVVSLAVFLGAVVVGSGMIDVETVEEEK